MHDILERPCFSRCASLIVICRLQVDSGTEVLTRVDGVVTCKSISLESIVRMNEHTELLLDTEDLVELGETLRTSGGTSLDLSSSQTNDDVSDSDILSLTRAVGHHDTPSSTERILGGLDSLGNGTDLVDLEEEGVARLELNSFLDELGVGDSQIITILLAEERFQEYQR